MIYAHCDLEALEVALRTHTGKSCRKLIVTESVFSMDGDFAPLSGITALAQHHGAAVLWTKPTRSVFSGPEAAAAWRNWVSSARRFRDRLSVREGARERRGAMVCGSATLKQFLINRARNILIHHGAAALLRSADWRSVEVGSRSRCRTSAACRDGRATGGTSLSDAGFDTGRERFTRSSPFCSARMRLRYIMPLSFPAPDLRPRDYVRRPLADGNGAAPAVAHVHAQAMATLPRLAQTLSSIRVHAGKSLHANSASPSMNPAMRQRQFFINRHDTAVGRRSFRVCSALRCTRIIGSQFRRAQMRIRIAARWPSWPVAAQEDSC